MRQAILSASIAVVGEAGLGSWTVERVAARAGCAKGLVVYHFGSKRALLEESASALGAAHQTVRQDAIAGRSGTAVLDALWQALLNEVRSGGLAGWLAVQSDPELRRKAQVPEQTFKTETQVASALAIGTGVLAPKGTLSAALDGVQLQLLGTPPSARDRGVYDRLWLALLAG
ncbi:MAG: TetR/AcrR family transcriptional regulator [Gemmatimonadales bacterium]